MVASVEARDAASKQMVEADWDVSEALESLTLNLTNLCQGARLRNATGRSRWFSLSTRWPRLE
jgi:hypothetical protein